MGDGRVGGWVGRQAVGEGVGWWMDGWDVGLIRCRSRLSQHCSYVLAGGYLLDILFWGRTDLCVV